MSDLTKNHLGKELTGEQIVTQLATMLGWSNVPPWHVLERDLAEKLRQLKEISREPQLWACPQGHTAYNTTLRTTCYTCGQKL